MGSEREGPERSRFEEVFHAHQRAVLGYALRRVAEPADAADVVAETFTIAWRRLAQVPHGGEARAWLFAVARRVIANQRRGQLRRHRLAERLRGELQTLDTVKTAFAADVEVITAFARLAQDDREVLELNAWEELEPAEIATVLGISPNAARSRLHRARKRLRSHLSATGVTPTTADAGERQ